VSVGTSNGFRVYGLPQNPSTRDTGRLPWLIRGIGFETLQSAAGPLVAHDSGIFRQHGEETLQSAAGPLVAHDSGVFRQHGEGLAADVGSVALQESLLSRLVAHKGNGPVPLVGEEFHTLRDNDFFFNMESFSYSPKALLCNDLAKDSAKL
jgi:hypothetical protein